MKESILCHTLYLLWEKFGINSVGINKFYINYFERWSNCITFSFKFKRIKFYFKFKYPLYNKYISKTPKIIKHMKSLPLFKNLYCYNFYFIFMIQANSFIFYIYYYLTWNTIIEKPDIDKHDDLRKNLTCTCFTWLLSSEFDVQTDIYILIICLCGYFII